MSFIMTSITNMRNYKEFMKLLGFILILVLTYGVPVESICIKTFLSNGNESEVKSITAPNQITSKPFTYLRNDQGVLIVSRNVTSSEPRSLHCIYRFVGRDNERVLLNFTSFKLRGIEPECNDQYVDVYSQSKSDQSLEHMMMNTRPTGRFCTSVSPRSIISIHNLLVLVVHSESYWYNKNELLFTGFYGFKSQAVYDSIGKPATNTICSHTIHSSDRMSGEFESIAYPGTYPKGLNCTYTFIGKPKQRLRLEFLDLDLYYGGSHCPLDSIKIFDGFEESNPLINTICGGYRSLVTYSTNADLLVVFTTTQRESEVHYRGFKAVFEFSDRFADLSNVDWRNKKHMRGSECDLRIVSSKGTQGVLASPRVTPPSVSVCRYIFEGLQTAQNYEKVSLKFSEFNLSNQSAKSTPTTIAPNLAAPASVLTASGNSSLSNLFDNLSIINQDFSANNSANQSSDQCNDNYVRIYTGELKPEQKQDLNDYDYVYCGDDIPSIIESDASTLLMEFNSGQTGGHFKAEYSFIDDYKISGVRISSGCDYLYQSSFQRLGTFNSPLHPSWYLDNMNCSFTFYTKKEEMLLLQFIVFKMHSSFDETVAGYRESCKGEDSMEILELAIDHSEQKILERTEVGTYCGKTCPGPLLSFKTVRINFRTNQNMSSYGFFGTYKFLSENDLRHTEYVTNCGGNIYASSRIRTGTIKSPSTYRPETNEKRYHFCTWNITARPSYRIALDFTALELDGNPLNRGCNSAAIRILVGHNSVPFEGCGSQKFADNNSTHQFISEGESLSVIFTTTKFASGANGFVATWTEIKKPSS